MPPRIAKSTIDEAGLTPTGAILAAVTALVVVATGRSARRIGLTAALAGCASLPWLAATAVTGSGTVGTDPAGVAAFAARAFATSEITNRSRRIINI